MTNYIVEKQDVATGEWTPVSKFVRQPEYEVTSLDEGKKYKFRVSAVNDYGVSEPLEADRAVTAVDEAGEWDPSLRSRNAGKLRVGEWLEMELLLK